MESRSESFINPHIKIRISDIRAAIEKYDNKKGKWRKMVWDQADIALLKTLSASWQDGSDRFLDEKETHTLINILLNRQTQQATLSEEIFQQLEETLGYFILLARILNSHGVLQQQFSVIYKRANDARDLRLLIKKLNLEKISIREHADSICLHGVYSLTFSWIIDKLKANNICCDPYLNLVITQSKYADILLLVFGLRREDITFHYLNQFAQHALTLRAISSFFTDIKFENHLILLLDKFDLLEHILHLLKQDHSIGIPLTTERFLQICNDASDHNLINLSVNPEEKEAAVSHSTQLTAPTARLFYVDLSAERKATSSASIPAPGRKPSNNQH